ncbi:MAG: energy-coupling factor transporter ATPase [Acholeplasmatales bacterium]|nr:MAG: energy-coupling factor transporter ATPase [Acholeplasmatales bacterium]
MGIKFEQVNFAYQGPDGQKYLALANINLPIHETGEFIALIGETGSGKTTLVQHMNALLVPDTGSVTILGVKVTKEAVRKKQIKLNPIRKKVGLVFQFPEYQLFEETVLKDIIFGPKNFGISDAEATARAHDIIKVVGLDESYLSRSPFNLSGGEKKRVSIAGILAMEPDILILDEPTSGLDPMGRDELLTVFNRIHTTLNKTIILITHDMNTVYRYAKRALVMRSGYLVYDGDPRALFSRNNIDNWNLETPDILSLQQAITAELGLKLPHIAHTEEDLLAMLEAVLS